MKAKSYYQQLKPIILDHVKHYKDDFLKYDKECLAKKPERFMICFRDTGTDFVHIDKWDELTREAIDDNYDLVRTGIFPRNDRFILGEKGGIREMSMGEAITELNAVKNTALEQRAICPFCKVDFHISTGIRDSKGDYYCTEYHMSKDLIAV